MKPEEYATKIIDDYCISSPKDLILEDVGSW